MRSGQELGATNYFPAEQHLPRDRERTTSAANHFSHPTLQLLGNTTHPDRPVWTTKPQSMPTLRTQKAHCAQGSESGLISTDRTELANARAVCDTVGSCCEVTQAFPIPGLLPNLAKQLSLNTQIVHDPEFYWGVEGTRAMRTIAFQLAKGCSLPHLPTLPLCVS